LFYARLKGISPEMEGDMVRIAMTEVMLERFRDFRIKQLSGGMKRRVSVAISLVSDPKIIFLDEPTTGLDPENRRQLWDILAAFRGKRAIVLTTHSMEEADVLCNRIGIVNDGILRCVSNQVRLKTLYGGGYHLFVNCQKQKLLSLQQKQEERKQKKKEREPEVRAIRPRKYSAFEEDEEIKETDALNGKLDLETVHQRVKDFIAQILPLASVIREFNGNFVY